MWNNLANSELLKSIYENFSVTFFLIISLICIVSYKIVKSFLCRFHLSRVNDLYKKKATEIRRKRNENLKQFYDKHEQLFSKNVKEEIFSSN